MSDHQNLSLAHELVCCFLERESAGTREAENHAILELLDVGGESIFINPIPGTTLPEICNNLQTVLRLASAPVSLPASGINCEGRQWAAQLQLERIHLFTRVCLALLCVTPAMQ